MSKVSQILVATRSSNNAERAVAESEISVCIQSNAHEFLSALLEKAADPHSDISDAQSALMVLKTSISKYWSPAFEQFIGPPLSHELRQFIRLGLMRILSVNAHPRVRAACASVISRIASLEYPDQWPDVVHQSIGLMTDSANASAVLGGLVLFRELLLETVREEDFMVYGQDVLTLLYNIAKPVSYDGRRLLALQCFHECITFLLMGDDDQMVQLESMANVFIPQWCQLFGEILSEPETFSQVDVVREILDSVNEIDSGFPQILESSLSGLFIVTSRVLESQQGETIEIENDKSSSDRDEVTSSLSSLLVTILQNKVARDSCLNSDTQITQFTDLLVSLAVIPTPIAEWWSENLNEFVTAELGLEVSEFNSRENAASLVDLAGKPLILSHLLDILANSQANPAFEEATLFLLASLIAQVNIDEYLSVINIEKFQTLLNSLEFTESNHKTPSPHLLLLVARKVLAASAVAKYGGLRIPNEIKHNLAMHPFKAPFSSNEVVRISQVRAVISVSSVFPAEFQKYQPDLLSLIGSLVEDADDDTPVLLTEAFGSVIKLNYNIVAQNPDAVNMIFALANKDTSDVDLNAQILDVVGEILDAVPSREVVSQIMQPILSTIVGGAQSNYEFSGDLYFALDLATAIFEHGDVELSTDEREQMLQSFYNVVTTTEDPQVLQAASFAYAALVKNINGGISSETAQNVLKVAAQLLNPDLTDSAALASGKLVTAIIEQFSSELSSELLTEIIDACAKRLASAKNALLIETLVLVFAELTLRNASAVVSLLSNLDMLEPVMKQWVPTFEVVRGVEEIHKNVRAFEFLFDLHDPRLAATILPDEPIRDSNQILTRRRAKNLKFTQIPLPLKILKLLLKELAQAPRPPTEDNGHLPPNAQTHLKQSHKNSNVSDDSDDDWDDELALNDEGDVLDFRLFGLIFDWLKDTAKDSKSIEWLSRLSPDEQQFLSSLS